MRRNPEFVAKPRYPDSGFVIGVPAVKDRKFFGDTLAEEGFDSAIGLIEYLGGRTKEIDFSSFAAAGTKLFNGPILAERFGSVGEFISSHRDEVRPVVSSIVDKAKSCSAVDLINEYYRLRELMNSAYDELAKIDALMVPTAGTIYKIKEVESDPVKLNANMGYCTYFANLFQLSALAVPATLREDGLPFGVCFLAGPQEDRALLSLGKRLQAATKLPLGADTSLCRKPYPRQSSHI